MNRRDILKQAAYTLGISTLPISLTLLQSCQPTGKVDWKPEVLNPEQAKLVENIAEAILPSDESMPGAKEVHCAEFVDLLIRDCISAEDRTIFLNGLSIINDECNKTVKGSLSNELSQEMIGYISNVDKTAFQSDGGPQYQAYRQLKQMILLGYYTSEKIMNNHLNYHAIPGEYRGCIDISTDERAYVDNNVAG